MDCFLHLWNVESGELKKRIQAHDDVILSVAYSTNTTLAASGCADRSIKIWNTNSWKVLFHLQGHVNSISSLRFDLSGNHVLSCGDRETMVWKVVPIVPDQIAQPIVTSVECFAITLQWIAPLVRNHSVFLKYFFLYDVVLGKWESAARL